MLKAQGVRDVPHTKPPPGPGVDQENRVNAQLRALRAVSTQTSTVWASKAAISVHAGTSAERPELMRC